MNICALKSAKKNIGQTKPISISMCRTRHTLVWRWISVERFKLIFTSNNHFTLHFRFDTVWNTIRRSKSRTSKMFCIVMIMTMLMMVMMMVVAVKLIQSFYKNQKQFKLETWLERKMISTECEEALEHRGIKCWRFQIKKKLNWKTNENSMTPTKLIQFRLLFL